jgi:hypothetical protein
MNANPTNAPEPQIVSAADVVQRMGGALKHPVQINHDAQGVGVTHAAMLIHPEWNQGAIKEKIDGHLKATGWKAGKGQDGGKTYESNGHKIHVAHVGQHLVISGQNKKGHPASPAPQPAPQPTGKGKNIQKSENIFSDHPFLDALQTEVDRTISFVSKASS